MSWLKLVTLTLSLATLAACSNPLGGSKSGTKIDNDFNPGLASSDPVAATSSITAAGPVLSNGTSTGSITIVLKDVRNSPVIGVTPTFSATDTGNDNVYGPCSPTNSSGVSTCTISSRTDGTKTLRVLTPIEFDGGSVVFFSDSAVSLAFVTQPSGGAAGSAWIQQPAVEVLNASGNRVTQGPDATTSVTLALTSGSGALVGTTTVAAVNGVATFSGLSLNSVGTKVVTASASLTGGAATLASSSFSVTHAPAAQLVFATEPSASTVAGAVLASQPVLQIQDAFGNLITSGPDSTALITLNLQQGTGTLSGTLTASAVGGIADFAGQGLSINLAGTNKILRATKSSTSGSGGVGALSANSGTFTITHGVATQIVYTTQPNGGAAGAAWTQQPILEIRDSLGNRVTTGADATATVNVALTSGTGTLTGTASISAVAGVATFSGLKISTAGSGKVLTATKSDTSGSGGTTSMTVASSSFSVSHGAASQITFSTQPSSPTVAVVAFSTQPVLEIKDSYGNLVTTGPDATAAVSLALQQGTGTLAGTSLTLNAVGGVADFTGQGLNIDLTGTNKVIRATKASTTGSGGVGALTADSNVLTITHGMASVIAYTTQPGGGTAGAAWSQQPVIEIRDAFGNRVTTGVDSTATISVALTTGTGTLAGTQSVAAVAGVATFTNLNLDRVGTDKVLTATKPDTSGSGGTVAATVASSTFNITHGAASQLVYTTEPGGGTAGQAWSQQPVLEIRDAYDNVVTSGSDGSVSVTVSLTTGNGTLSGTKTVSASSGVATFSGQGLSINLMGTDKVLTASASVAGGAITKTSAAFTITPAAASQLAFTTQPGGGQTGAVWSQQPVVQVQDAYGNLVSSGADSTVSVSVALTTGTGVLLGTTSKTASSGVADFAANGLKINLQGTNKVLTASATLAGGAKTVASSAFSITLGTTNPVAWSFTAGSEADYSFSSASIGLGADVLEIKPYDQTDSTSANFSAATAVSGVDYDSTNKVLRLNSNGGCDGTTTNCAELDSSWAPQWSSIIGYWKLNEASWNGTVGEVLDASGNGNTGQALTYYGGGGLPYTTTSSKMGVRAGYFRGDRPSLTASYMDYVSIPTTNATLKSVTNSDFTFAAWYRPDSYPENQYNRTQKQCIIGKNGYHTGISYKADGTFEFVYSYLSNGSNAQAFVGSPGKYVPGEFHHVVGTTDLTAKKAYLYVDGEQVMSKDLTGTVTPYNYTGALFIGTCAAASGSGSYSYFSHGTIDDVAVWTKQLLPAEVQLIYSRQSAKFSCQLTSRIWNAQTTGQAWNALKWITSIPFFKELVDTPTTAPVTSPISESKTSSYTSLVSGTLMTGLQGLWHLNESSAGTAPGGADFADTSGLGRHGTQTNGVTFGKYGRFGLAPKFDGSNDQVDTTAFDLGATSNLTFAGWFKNLNSAIAGTQGMVYKSSVFEVYVNAGIIYVWVNNTGGWHQAATSPAYSDWSLWTHIAVTYDGSQVVIYRNGVAVTTAPETGGALVAASTALRIGLQSSGGTKVWNGFIDELALWSRTLSDTEIKQIYRRGANRVKFQVRSCVQADCSDATTWRGSDSSGTNQAYITELNNVSSGRVQAGLPSPLFTSMGWTAASNQYFQYRTVLESDDVNALCDYGSGSVNCSPELKSAQGVPLHYGTTLQTVITQVGTPFYNISSFTETLGAGTCASAVKYALSLDKTNWYWWNSGAWALGDGSANNANTAAQLTNTVVGNFAQQVGTGSVYLKAFLQSSGAVACEVDAVTLGVNQ